MSHSPGWPDDTQGPAQVERVCNDGNWITGDPLDTTLISWRADGRTIEAAPRLMVYRMAGAGQLPDFSGWKTPRFGSASGPDHMVMEYEARRLPAPRKPASSTCWTPTTKSETKHPSQMPR